MFNSLHCIRTLYTEIFKKPSQFINNWWKDASTSFIQQQHQHLQEYPPAEQPAVQKSQIQVLEPLIGADTNNHNDVEFFLTKVYSKIMNSSIRTAVIYGDEQTAVSLMWSQIAEYPNAHHMWVVPFPGELVPFSGPFDPWWNLQALSKSAFAFRELLGKGQDYCRFFEQVLAQTRRLSNHDGGRCSEVASTSPEPSKQPNSSRTFRKSCQQQELLPCLVFPLSLWTGSFTGH